MNITESELLDALREASGSRDVPEGALTVAEISEGTGKHRSLITRDLRRLFAAGRVEMVRVPLMRIDGVQTLVPAYRVVKQHPTPKKRGATKQKARRAA